MPMPVWFDRKKISLQSEEDFESCTEMCHNINHLVEAEVNKGIALNRIIVGMFEQCNVNMSHYCSASSDGFHSICPHCLLL